MVKLLTSIASATFSYSPGDTVKLDEKTEKRLVETGQAIKVSTRKKAAKK
jgi:hypothetical protein